MANYKIEDVEGIGKVLGAKLREVGIKDTDTLLENVGTRAQRRDLAKRSGLTANQVLKFANMVDLYRINGIGSEYSELLEAAGVDTVIELARRNIANLTKRMLEVNETRKLTRKPPTESEVTRWIDQAKGMPRMLHY